MTPNILLFEPEIKGHHAEYVRNLLTYWAEATVDCRITLVAHPHLARRFPDILQITRQREDAFALVELTQQEVDRVTETPGKVRRSLAAWAVVERYLARHRPDHMVLLDMNVFQLALGLPCARRQGVSISGILFFPFVRIERPSPGLLPRLRTWTHRARKAAQLFWVLQNPAVARIFILNDDWAARQLNRRYGTDVFAWLPDPLPQTPDAPAETRAPAEENVLRENRLREDAENGRRVVLMFGALRKNKGVQQAIEAFAMLDADTAQRLTFWLFGEAQPDLADELPHLVEKLRQKTPNLCVSYEDRFLDWEEVGKIFRASDVVLAPYQRTEGSSGIIGHAARYNTPIIGPSTGLVGDLVRRYGLGCTVDASSAAAIARVLRRVAFATKPLGDPEGMAAYVRERAPGRFARKVFHDAMQAV